MKLKQLLEDFIQESVNELVCVNINGDVLCTIYNPAYTYAEYYDRYDNPLNVNQVCAYPKYDVVGIRTRNGNICVEIESPNGDLKNNEWLEEF